MTLCKQIFENFACKNGDKFTGLHILGGFFWRGWNLSMCKLQCELLATAALFAHIHVLREKIFLFFFFDYGVTLCMQVASTAHSLISLHRALPAGYLSVCIQKELFLRGLKGNSVAALQLFSARGINKSARFCSLGSGYWFLHKVMLVLSVKSKVASKL